jgi:hypothetical protein
MPDVGRDLDDSFQVADNPGVGPSMTTWAFVSSNRGQHGILAQNHEAPCAAFLDLRWNRPKEPTERLSFYGAH